MFLPLSFIIGQLSLIFKFKANKTILERLNVPIFGMLWLMLMKDEDKTYSA